ncbi:type II secretion system F family protein [Georgenia sp. H159]|uniref:type II secretion system F family protein n=1 Tax=Georgenia sp. H159 TaxID=3076115 RepID=UPI002D772D1A|nr:type II secretion system F family protein [Georgenia sp. H159]
MSATVLTAAVLTALAVGLATWAVWPALDPDRRRVLANLNRVSAVAVPDGEQPEEERRSALTALARRLTPDLVVRVLDRQHVLAGRPARWSLDALLTLKLVWVPAAVLLNVLVLASSPSPLLSVVWVLVTVVVYFLPELLLNSTGQKRNEQIELSLADTLDQMTIAVEAGLGFDSAMSRAAHNGRGALADELARTLQDVQMGRSRRQAFEALTERTTVPDLRRFVRAVIQADAYGISIADVLRTQADEMRLKRRQRAEEKAQKIPVKVLAPLMLCILPVLFIVVMGPAVMSMVAAFGAM